MTPNTKLALIWTAIVSVLVIAMLWSLEESQKFSCRAVSYQVNPGDTAFQYALKSCDGNITNAVQRIMDHNGMISPDDMQVGQIVIIPES